MRLTPKRISRDEAENVALGAFSYITSNEEALTRFLSISGLQPDTIRSAAAAPGFLAGILDYVAADEPLLLVLAEAMNTTPERIMEAHRTLSPTEFE
ncbi:DUF3572 domain-containing protein [Microvirga roseola]|uniref:DUF3572 domain-containing protein n=1 Tax=Microvirga roseola TaxID=2883126 RepID=UPI001E59037E|nr:DUF3572 domain-containing protein [Microvirga roseola]